MLLLEGMMYFWQCVARSVNPVRLMVRQKKLSREDSLKEKRRGGKGRGHRNNVAASALCGFT